MSAPIKVRAVRPEDYAGWYSLWEGYNAFYERQGPSAAMEWDGRLSPPYTSRRTPLQRLVGLIIDALLRLDFARVLPRPMQGGFPQAGFTMRQRIGRRGLTNDQPVLA